MNFFNVIRKKMNEYRTRNNHYFLVSDLIKNVFFFLKEVWGSGLVRRDVEITFVIIRLKGMRRFMTLTVKAPHQSISLIQANLASIK